MAQKEQSRYDYILSKLDTSPVIDRINPSKGYTKDNIQLVCSFIGQMKGDMTEDELFVACYEIVKSNKDKIEKLLKTKNIETPTK